MPPQAIRRELRRHHDPQVVCQCLACLYGRALLAKVTPKVGIVERLRALLVRKAA